MKRKLTWFHPLIYLSLAAGLLILVILVLVLQKKATIYIGLSQEWWHKRRRALWIGWLMGLGGLAVMIGSGVLLGNCPRGQESWTGVGIVLGLVMLLGGLVYGSTASRMVVPVRITDTHVWLKGVHPDYLADLPPWPYQP